MNDRPLLSLGLALSLLACLGCDNASDPAQDPLAALTPYQRTAIEMCNQGEKRLQEYHQTARQAGSRKIYVGLSAPLLAKTIQTYTGDSGGTAFREFVTQFATDEASFVWQNRTDSPARLLRAHLKWCREQDDWISSYR